MIQTKQVTVYTTTDGQEFLDDAAAGVHQAQLDASAQIDAFVAAQGLDGASATRTRNTLLSFVGFAAADAAAA